MTPNNEVPKRMLGIKYRAHPNDSFITPTGLAMACIEMVNLQPGDVVLDPAKGTGIFYDNFPSFVTKSWCEIEEGIDFFNQTTMVDWAVTNPPYSKLDAWLEKSCLLCHKGFAYLLNVYAITPKRIKRMNELGFGLTYIHLCKVFHFFGMSAFVIFEKGKPNIISYDRIVWRSESDISLRTTPV